MSGAPQPVPLTVDITVHGPVMTQAGQTTAVDWMGNIASPDIAVMFGVSKAHNFAQFRAALAGWRAPSQNFVYADDHGNIGAISAGYYPLVRHGDPWLPLPGTGADDVAGIIPYRAVPQVYDPPGHLVATANQRPVGPSYPYYIGTSANFFDPGYRVSEIYASLRGRSGLRPADFAAVQLSLADALAGQIVPGLLAALHGQQLTAQQRAAAGLLAGWHDDHGPHVGRRGGVVDVLDRLPRCGVPALVAGRQGTGGQGPARALDLPAGSVQPGPDARVLDHERSGQQRVHPARRPAPDRPGGDAGSVRHRGGAPGRGAGRDTLGLAVGPDPQPPVPVDHPGGRARLWPALVGRDAWTVDAADGGLVSHQGPSWRMIVAWTDAGAATGQGVYPGGQSENPASPWYSDQMADWWDGRYLPMPPAGGLLAGPIVWSLRP